MTKTTSTKKTVTYIFKVSPVEAQRIKVAAALQGVTRTGLAKTLVLGSVDAILKKHNVQID